MKIKKGVRLFGVRPEMVAIFPIVARVYVDLGNAENCVLTSVTEGKHSRGSDHYVGNATDWRVWGFSDAERAEATEMIDERTSEEFEVFDETNHIHVGFDPSVGLNMEVTDNK